MKINNDWWIRNRNRLIGLLEKIDKAAAKRLAARTGTCY